MTTTSIRNTISLGKVDGYGNGRKTCLVTLELEIKPIQGSKIGIDLEPVSPDADSLSIRGNVWNQGKTDIISGGQNIDEIKRHFRGSKRVRRIVEIWERYHLNDMKSGTDRQSACIDAHMVANPDWRYDFSQACEILRANGLLVDRGYSYGSKWLCEVIPTEVIAEIKQLFGLDD